MGLKGLDRETERKERLTGDFLTHKNSVGKLRQNAAGSEGCSAAARRRPGPGFSGDIVEIESRSGCGDPRRPRYQVDFFGVCRNGRSSRTEDGEVFGASRTVDSDLVGGATHEGDRAAKCEEFLCRGEGFQSGSLVDDVIKDRKFINPIFLRGELVPDATSEFEGRSTGLALFAGRCRPAPVV